jgi:hypothetical protein
MKYLLFLVLIVVSCQNEKPYLVDNTDTIYKILKFTDTVYVHDTIVKFKRKQPKELNHIKNNYGVRIGPERLTYVTDEILNMDTSWEVVKKASTIEIKDSLNGGYYSVSSIGDMQDDNVELNYSIDNKIQIGWDGKKWVMCGMDGWGDCSIHLYHKSLREILDSANHK